MADSPLGRLIGTWEFEPFVDGKPAGRGRATFEWIEDGAFVVERSKAEWSDPGWVENAPVSTRAVIGWDDSTDEIVQLYSDSRGVLRIYRGTLTDGAWTLERAAPDSTSGSSASFATTGGRLTAGGSRRRTAVRGSSTSPSPTARLRGMDSHGTTSLSADHDRRPMRLGPIHGPYLCSQHPRGKRR